MRQADFEQLIRDTGLNLLSNYASRFVVSLAVERAFGIRYQCETLAYAPAELALLTPERAKQQVERCKNMLEQAARTQQGRTVDEYVKQTEPKPVQKVVGSEKTVKYPAH